jgi:hypothetical protein
MGGGKGGCASALLLAVVGANRWAALRHDAVDVDEGEAALLRICLRRWVQAQEAALLQPAAVDVGEGGFAAACCGGLQLIGCCTSWCCRGLRVSLYRHHLHIPGINHCAPCDLCRTTADVPGIPAPQSCSRADNVVGPSAGSKLPQPSERHCSSNSQGASPRELKMQKLHLLRLPRELKTRK